MAVPPSRLPARRWRFYRTERGADPVRAYLAALPAADRAVVKAQMKRVREDPRAGRHLAGGIYEVRASRGGRAHRVTFVREARANQVLLAVDAFLKTTARTPPGRIRLAGQRATEWRQRGQRMRRAGEGRQR